MNPRQNNLIDPSRRGAIFGLLGAVASVALLFAGCDEEASGISDQPCPNGICSNCTVDADCPQGQQCLVGFCTMGDNNNDEPDAGDPPDAEDPPDVNEPEADASEDAEGEEDTGDIGTADAEGEDAGGDIVEPEPQPEPQPEPEPEPEPEPCLDDGREENDRPLQAPALLVGQEHPLALCPGDEDWFIVSTERRETLEVFVATEAALEVTLVQLIDGRTVLATAEAGGEGYRLSFEPPEPGSFLLRVRELEVGLRVEYTLRYLGQRALCEDDEREEDDFIEDALPITVEDAPISGFLCEGDEDWLAIEIDGFFQIRATIDYDAQQSNGLIRVGLFDGQEELIAQTNDANRSFAFLVDGSEAGTFFLRIDGQGGAEGAYTLDLDLSVNLCEPDAAEPNDLPDEATALVSGRPVDGLALCENDVDWFTFEAVPNQTVRALVTTAHEGVPFSVEVIAPDTVSIISSTVEGEGGPAAVAITREPGAHFVRVFSEVGDRDDYSLVLDIDPCPADAFEPNNTPEAATRLPLGINHPALRICDQDRDWFLFEDVPEAHRVLIEASLGFGQGDLVARWFRPDDLENPIQQDAIGDPLVSIAHVTDAAGDLLLELSGQTSERGYTLRATLEDTAECAPDDAEPNDFVADAVGRPLAPGFFDGLTICAGDFDHYCTTIPARQTLTATITFEHDLGDLEAQLVTGIGLPLASSATNRDSEVVTFEHGGDTPLVACVLVAAQRFDLDVTTRYDMLIEITGVELQCTDDRLEDNDDEESATLLVDRRSAPQQPIPPGRIFSNPEDQPAISTLRGQVLCEGDPDLFAFQGRAGDTLQVDLDFVHDNGDLSLSVLRPRGLGQIAAVDSLTDGETLTVELPANDTYLIQVDGDGTFRQNYSMDVSLRGACVLDLGEPNENPDAATLIEPGAHTGLGLCAREEDWLAIDLAVGDTLRLSALYDPHRVDLDLDLFDPDRRLLARSNSGGGVDAITLTASTTGRYFIRIYPFDNSGVGASTTYDLIADVTPEPDECTVDSAEPNDDDASARRLPFTGGLAEFSNLTLCQNDVDTYTFVLLGEEQDLSVFVTVPTTVPQSSSVLITPNGDILTGDPDLGGRSISLSAAPVGLYTLRVRRGGAGTIQATYSVKLATNSDRCLADAFEPNDNPNLPSTPGLGALRGLRLCGDERDCFAADTRQGERLLGQLLFDNAAGNLRLGLQDPDLLQLGISDGLGHTERIDHLALQSGEHVFCVTGQGVTTEQRYDLLLLSGGGCLDDIFEPNDSQPLAQAFPVNASLTAQTCGDEDWFRVPAVAGQRLDILLNHEVDGVQLNLTLMNAQGQILEEGQGSGGERFVDRIINQGGDLFVGVRNPGRASALYTLRVLLEDPVGGCVTDAQEEDDNPAQATALNPGAFVNATLCDEVDHFRVAVTRNTELVVEVASLPSLGSVNVDIFDAAGSTLLASGSPIHNATRARHTSNINGAVIVRVTPRGGYRGPYTIGLQPVGANASCLSDLNEPDEDDPTPIGGNGGLRRGAVCDESVDRFSIDLDAGDKLDLNLDFDEGAGDLNLALIGPNNATVATSTSSAPGRSKEIIGANITASGTYEIHVTPAQIGQRAAYDLTWRTLPSINCVNDAREPDDDVNQARPIAPGLLTSLHVCSGDEDWSFITLRAGQTIEINLAYPPGGPDVELQLLAVDQRPLAGSFGASGLERISFTATSSQIHFVRVFVPGRGPSPYVMDLTVTQ